MSVVYFILTVMLTKQLVMATEQCSNYHFKSLFYPVKTSIAMQRTLKVMTYQDTIISLMVPAGCTVG